MSHKTKRIVALVSVLVILAAGLYAVIYAFGNIAPTYDGSRTDIVALYNDPSSYDNSDPDGVASIIVNENLERTYSANNVNAVVFDFRGYDTLGEAFILLTAVCGTFVILSRYVQSDIKKGDRN